MEEIVDTVLHSITDIESLQPKKRLARESRCKDDSSKITSVGSSPDFEFKFTHFHHFLFSFSSFPLKYISTLKFCIKSTF